MIKQNTVTPGKFAIPLIAAWSGGIIGGSGTASSKLCPVGESSSLIDYKRK
uniref:Uncharacterized protein n=1 Tax=Candidatus Kentrum sp. TC TaxID=2126339 RepID=A0A450YZT6_9GAMM|nr:MAG: hypothetical protein BECKTC1821D_GA0114238_103916 [Candidatus Kentron sp. TC]